MPLPTPTDRLAELAREIDGWTVEQIRERGRFFRTDAAKVVAALQGNASGKANLSLVDRILEQLGDCVALGETPRQGMTRTGVLRPPVTLDTLVQAAQAALVTDGSHAVARGERATRDVHLLTQSQYDGCVAAAKLVADLVTGDSSRLTDVGPEHFTWDAYKGRGGRGDWVLIDRVATHSDDTARRAFRAKHGAAAPYDVAQNRDRRFKHMTGVRTLLDLAATKGLLQRGAGAQSTAAATVHHPDWQPELDRWIATHGCVGATNAIAERPIGGTTARKIARGCRTLALYASRRGWRNSREADWATVQEALTAAHADGAGPLSSDVFTWARYAYRVLVAAGEIPGPGWPLASEDRTSLVAKRAITRAARFGDFGEWLVPEAASVRAARGASEEEPIHLVPARGLTEGLYGLGDWRRWATLSPEELEEAKLPARAYVNPTVAEQVRMARRGDDEMFRCDPATIDGRVSDFAWQAGWCQRHAGIEWDVTDASELANPEYLRRHVRMRDAVLGRKPGDPDTFVSKVAYSLAMFASPFCEARAAGAAADAERNGMIERATQLRARAAQLHAWSGELKVIAARRRSVRQKNRREGDDISRREAHQLWLVWSADGTSGWHKLGRLRDLLIADAERAFAGCCSRTSADGKRVPMRELDRVSISEQIAWIGRESEFSRADRTFIPSQEWAVLVRDAVVFGVLYRIPLRERNMLEMRLDNWRSMIDGRPGMPWEGDISFAFEGYETKGDRAFHPTYLHAEEHADPEMFAAARPDLLQVYFMANGAREELLRLVGAQRLEIREGDEPTVLQDGDVIPSSHVFPSLARRPGRSSDPVSRLRAGCQWDAEGFRGQWRNRIREYADAIGIDFPAVSALFGGAGPHCARHLFGTHHCWPSKFADAIGLENASAILGHRDTEVTRRKYVGITERQVKVSAGHAAGTSRAHGVAARIEMTTATSGSPRLIEDTELLALIRRRELEDAEQYLTGAIDDAEYGRRKQRVATMRERATAA